MAEWATFVIVGTDGGHTTRESRFGAVGLGLDLLAGPDVVLPFALAHREGGWRDDVHCEAAALIDAAGRALLTFAWEGPAVRYGHRGAALELLRRAWPGWDVRWTYDGPAALRLRLGLDPEVVRVRDLRALPGPVLGPDEAEPDDVDELASFVDVVTIGEDRCHIVHHGADHPVAEGLSLVERLAAAQPRRRWTFPAGGGIHVDPSRRRIGWWTLGARPGAYAMSERWPGWTVEFWRDRCERHVRVSGGRFAPPPVDRLRALSEVRDEALAHWSVARAAAGPELSAVARRNIDRAWRAAVGRSTSHGRG